MQQNETARHILRIARELLADGGPSALSFDAIARRLGRSKQAVLYWFPTKQALLAALFLPALRAETRAVEDALAHRTGPAAEAAIRALADFHLSDLGRFRMMYLSSQTVPQGSGREVDPRLLDQVHEVTDGLYSALAKALGAESTLGDPRRDAATLHAATLGLVLMLSLADSLDDPLKHDTEALVGGLVARWVPS
jgi:AcrR family transcriptional regulator